MYSILLIFRHKNLNNNNICLMNSKLLAIRMAEYYRINGVLEGLGLCMARYTCSFILSVSIDDLQPLLVDLLQANGLEVQYYNADSIMAREVPGSIAFPKLVTVEIFIDKTTATESETRMNIVIKNQELPLQLDNHCRQVFEFIKQEIEQSRHWHLIESLAG